LHGSDEEVCNYQLWYSLTIKKWITVLQPCLNILNGNVCIPIKNELAMLGEIFYMKTSNV